MVTYVCVILGVTCAALILRKWLGEDGTPPQGPHQPHQGYVLENVITHARLLPQSSTHSFSYRTLALFTSLNALEKHDLDLGNGWLFRYSDSNKHGSLSEVLPCNFLDTNPHKEERPGDPRGPPASIKTKLIWLLDSRGFRGDDLGDAWMLALPTFMGVDVTNSLIVYFCYKSDVDKLWLVICEIHSTFGERHAYVLEVGKSEDNSRSIRSVRWESPIGGGGGERPADPIPCLQVRPPVDSSSVSPFNDRSGFYKISITEPSHHPSGSPATAATTKNLNGPPRPVVRVHLHTFDPARPRGIGPLKLTAGLRPIISRPLTTWNYLHSLARLPFAMLLSLPRISYQAFILHYQKNLEVYPRPDPLPSVVALRDEPGLRLAIPDTGGGIGWIPESLLEKYARWRLDGVFKERCKALNVNLTLISGDPSVPPIKYFGESEITDQAGGLKIIYRSPRFFTALFTSPSPQHTLLLNRSENLFFVSSEQLLVEILNAAKNDTSRSLRQLFRSLALPSSSRTSEAHPIPSHNALDNNAPSPSVTSLLDCVVLVCLIIKLQLMRFVFGLVGIRFVQGQEPWLVWQRALTKRRGVGGKRHLNRS